MPRSYDTLEVELEGDLSHARRHDDGGPLPVRVEREVVKEAHVVVEGIVKVEHRLQPRPSKSKILREPQVELIDPISVHRTGRDHVDPNRAGLRQRPPQRGFDLCIRIHALGAALGAGEALEGRRDLNLVRQRVRTEELEVRLERLRTATEGAASGNRAHARVTTIRRGNTLVASQKEYRGNG